MQLNNNLIAHWIDHRSRAHGPVWGEPWRSTPMHPARETRDTWSSLLADLWRKWRGR